MSPEVLAHQTGGSVPVFTLLDEVDAGTAAELRQRVSAALGDGHQLVVIDLLASPAVKSQILSEQLRAALRGVSGPARLAVIAGDPRQEWARELAAIDAVELHPTITSITDAGSDASATGEGSARGG